MNYVRYKGTVSSVSSSEIKIKTKSFFSLYDDITYLSISRMFLTRSDLKISDIKINQKFEVTAILHEEASYVESIHVKPYRKKLHRPFEKFVHSVVKL